MCGIAGFVGEGKEHNLNDMKDFIAHRGPDEEGSFIDKHRGIYLGHRRLSILDLSDGKQPMSSLSGEIVIVYNGEIYNGYDIKKELLSLGYQFKTDHSDTEVILNSYLEWGRDCVHKFEGMWAFAIYDKRDNILFISRDRFGKKPLFYAFMNNTFVFSSELNALTSHPVVKDELSKRSLKKYFAYGFIPAPNTLYQNIYKLPAGHHLIYQINQSQMNIIKYWEYLIEPFDTVKDNSVELWCEELRDLLDKAVQRRMSSDVPLGVFLSGGVDSSSIVAFASNRGKKRVKTFSIGFEEASFDESAYAHQVSQQFNSHHHSEILSIDRALDILPDILHQLDEPFGDSSIMPTYLLAQITRKKVTVALGGDGADELFAGYDPFKALTLASLYNKLVPKKVHAAIFAVMARLPVGHNNMSLDFKIKRTLRGLSYDKKFWNSIWLGPLAPDELDDLFNEPTELEETYEEAIQAWDSTSQNNIIDKTLQFYTRLYLQDNILVKADRATMMNSLEVRSPYLDKDLVDFIRKIPANYKYRNRETKYLLKKALEPVLHQDILYRPKKGFGVPVGKWFAEKKMFCDSLKENQLHRTIPFLNSTFIENKFTEHLSHKSDQRAFLWNYLVLDKKIHNGL